MKIYLASSWRNETIYYQILKKILYETDYDIYDFKDPKTSFRWQDIDKNWKDWTIKDYLANLQHEYAKRGFNQDFSALKECDICILILPCGSSAHLEAGYAKGANKLLIIYIDKSLKFEAELMYKIADFIVDDINDLIMILKNTYK